MSGDHGRANAGVMAQRIIRFAFVVALGAVTVGSLVPGTYVAGIDIWDKALHLVGYGILALLAALAFEFRGAAWRIAAGLGLWGGMIEVAQQYVPGRSADWIDAAINAAGVVSGLLLAPLATRLVRAIAARRVRSRV